MKGKEKRPVITGRSMKKTNRAQSPVDLLSGNGLNSGSYNLLLLLLAGNQGGGRKGDDSDGLHNIQYVFMLFQSAGSRGR
jgi:hypothetical protein